MPCACGRIPTNSACITTVNPGGRNSPRSRRGSRRARFPIPSEDPPDCQGTWGGKRATSPRISPRCERGDSNPHGLPHWILNPARLPIPPLSLGRSRPASHRTARDPPHPNLGSRRAAPGETKSNNSRPSGKPGDASRAMHSSPLPVTLAWLFHDAPPDCASDKVTEAASKSDMPSKGQEIKTMARFKAENMDSPKTTSSPFGSLVTQLACDRNGTPVAA